MSIDRRRFLCGALSVPAAAAVASLPVTASSDVALLEEAGRQIVARYERLIAESLARVEAMARSSIEGNGSAVAARFAALEARYEQISRSIASAA